MKMPSVVFQTISLWRTLESYETTTGGQQSNKLDVFRIFQVLTHLLISLVT